MVLAVSQVQRQTVNIEDAGKILGISRHTAYQLARRDELPVPVIRIGRRIVVSLKALEGVLEARKESDAAQQNTREGAIPRVFQMKWRHGMSVTQIIHNRDGSVDIRFRYDPVFIDQIKNEIPSWFRKYRPSDKAWTVQSPYVDHLIRLARDRFGFVEIWGEPATGTRFHESNECNCDCDNAHRKLYVTQDAPGEVVKAAYRALARVNHPDGGGDHNKMIELTDAYEKAMEAAR